jgi:hypothetical protein
MFVVTLPPVPKVVSRVPLVLYRASSILLPRTPGDQNLAIGLHRHRAIAEDIFIGRRWTEIRGDNPARAEGQIEIARRQQRSAFKWFKLRQAIRQPATATNLLTGSEFSQSTR